MISIRLARKKGSSEDPLLEKVRQMNGAVFVLLLLVSSLLMPLRFTFGVGLGGLIILINFSLLYRILKKALIPNQLSSPKVVIIKYYLRLLGTGILLYLLISQKIVDPLGLILGLSVVVINLTLMGLNEMRKIFFKEAN
jgi:hypothetical protein